jgi:exonuclease SbcC
MDGFGAFRARTEVDFAEADFFALVGSTGSGKSTVIDAICFALYGSVPRYADRRVVAPVMSTGAVETRVELTFSVGGADHRAVRVVRRARNGTASTKEARLERLEGGHPVAPPLAATAAELDDEIAGLLGLPFEHFTRCVVLPQGQFARFLHDTPGDRQKLLRELLQTGIYERLMQAANRRAVEAQGEGRQVVARIEAKGDLSDAALDAATGRLAELDGAIGRVAALESLLRDRRDEAASVAQRVGTVQHELLLLGGVAAPDEVGVVEEALARATVAVTTRQVAAEAARERAVATGDVLRALPSRDLLEQTVTDHRDLATAAEELAGHRAALEAAVAAEAEAVEGLGRAAARREEIAAAAAARDRLAALVDAHGELDALADSLQALARDRAAVAGRRSDLGARCDELARSVAALRRAAAPRDLLARLTDVHADAAGARTARQEAQEQAAVADRRRVAAQSALAGAEEALAAATAAQREQERGQLAASLAGSLRVGDPCPVCHHLVDALPVHEAHADLEQAQEAVVAASEAADRARREQLAAAGELAARRVAAQEAERRVEEAEGSLAELAGQVGDASLAAATPAAAEAAMVARRRAEEAQRDLAGAERDLAAADGALAEASTDAVLLDERHRVAEERRQVVAAQLAGSPGRDEVAAALAAAERAAEWLVERDDELRVARDAHTAAVSAVSGARARVEAGERRCADLQGRVDARGRSAGEAVALLVEVAAAEAAVAAAREEAAGAAQELEAARRGQAEAEARHRELERALIAVRDSVAALGPPAWSDGPLAGRWRELEAWVAERSAEGGRTAARLAAEAAALQAGIAEAQGRRGEEAALVLGPVAHGLEASALHTALQRARAEAELAVTRIGAGRHEVAELEVEREAWREREQVARELGRLLNTQNFEKWLLGEALRSLVAAASLTMERLSGGQFGLECPDGSDFLVVDHHNADERRPVRSLSGGETFQASLALALALSQELGGLAAASATRLESIFLDEGFGTLDAETLDTVADTIETLGSDGRMVGIITHVRELAERVPVRFRVTKGERSAAVEREAAG